MEHFDLSFMALMLASAASALSLATGPDALQVELINKEGTTVGTVTLTEYKRGVKIEVDAHGLKPGKHAFHIHEKGSCIAPDFKSAGEHLGINGRKHGYDVKGGPHQGDLPHLIADGSGAVRAEIISTEVTIKEGPRSLFKPGGTAFVIHEGTDDQRSQPSGDSGERIACAELRSTAQKSASLR